MAYPRSIALPPQFLILNASFSILLPQISLTQPQFSLLNSSSSILSEKYRIFDSKSPWNSVISDKMSASAATTATSFFQVCKNVLWIPDWVVWLKIFKLQTKGRNEIEYCMSRSWYILSQITTLQIIGGGKEEKNSFKKSEIMTCLAIILVISWHGGIAWDLYRASQV